MNYKLTLKTKSKISFQFKPQLVIEKFLFNNDVDQTIISYKDKYIGFCEALKKLNNNSYEKILVHEAIDTFEGNKTLQYFLLLFSHCNQKDIYKLFCLFPTDIKDINENINFQEEKNNFAF